MQSWSRISQNQRDPSIAYYVLSQIGMRRIILRNYLTFHVEKQHALVGLKLGITCLLTHAFSPIADENIKN
jgi:hypothetical protein